MSHKPYQSCLLPYVDEIIALRRRKPPTSYAKIAGLLQEKYQITISRESIFRFLQTRSKGYKVCKYAWNQPAKPDAVNPSHPVARPQVDQPSHVTPVAPKQNSNPKPSSRFEYTYSDHYNLHRLTPDEAEALRKKLSEGNQ